MNKDIKKYIQKVTWYPSFVAQKQGFDNVSRIWQKPIEKQSKEKNYTKVDRLILKLPTIMRENGFHKGGDFMEKWLSAAPIREGKVKDIEKINWGYLKSFDRVKTGLDTIKRKVLELDRNRATASLYMKSSIETRKAFFKLKMFLDSSKKQIEMSGESSEYRFYIGAEKFSYSDGFDLYEDDLSVSMGKFAIKIGLKGKFKQYDSKIDYYPFIVEKYDVSVNDSYDFDGWQALGMWSDLGLVKKNGILLSNHTFQDFRDKHFIGRDFSVIAPQEDISLDKPIVIYVHPDKPKPQWRSNTGNTE